MARKVRVGMIGAIWWGEMMFVPALRAHPGAELVAIASRNAEAGAAFATSNNIARHFTDYRDMLAEAQLDAVIVATPDDQHRDMTLAALDAGLHVLCEKPLALNSADAETMLQRATASGRVHMVNFTWRWQPSIQFLKALLDDGYVGRPLRAQFSFSGGWAHQRNYQWRQDGARANGVLGDLGAHMIDLSNWLIGRAGSVSAHVPVLIDRTGFDGQSPRPANDTAHLTLNYANGAEGVIDVTALMHLGSALRIGVRIDGTGGSVALDFEPLGPNAGARLSGMRLGEREVLELPIPPEYHATPPEAHMDIYQQRSVGPRLFIDAILGGFQPEPGFDAGVEVQRIIDAALVSHRDRRWVDL